MPDDSTKKFNFDCQPSVPKEEILTALREYGAVGLRNLFGTKVVLALTDAAHRLLEEPNISGNFGYIRPDYPKKVVDPFQIDEVGAAVCLNDELTDLVESYMGADCVLSEAFIKLDRATPYVYFPLHTDYAVGTQRHKNAPVVTSAMLSQKLGVGAAVYLEDCSSGAFVYGLGTHELGAPYGQDAADYPKGYLEKNVLPRLHRFDGKAGDVVLFDDRGFHGPDQPAQQNRLCLLLDWTNVEAWGGPVQVKPFSLWTTDIARLTPRQLRVAGVGAQPFGPATEYHFHRRFKEDRPLAYSLARLVINTAFVPQHLRATLRSKLRARR